MSDTVKSLAMQMLCYAKINDEAERITKDDEASHLSSRNSHLVSYFVGERPIVFVLS